MNEMLLDTVTCGDWRDLLRALEPGSVDLLLTDPPYACGKVSAWRSLDLRFQEIEGMGCIESQWLIMTYDKLRIGGAVYMFAKWQNVGEWKNHIETAGFSVRNCIIWDKLQHGTGDLETTYGPQYEMILFATKGRHVLNHPRPTDVIRCPKIQPIDLLHPYEKPVELLMRLIKVSTQPGDLVVDPFVGSGTTALAARNTGRHFIVGDLDTGYCEIARRRLAEPYTLPMFPDDAAPEPSAMQLSLLNEETL